MKVSKWFGTMLVCLSAAAFSIAGCSDDDDGGGNNGGGNNSELSAAAQDACENAVGCARDAGAPISNEQQFCAAYNQVGSTAGVDQNCVDKAKAYLDCVADAECDDFSSCDDANDEVADACENDTGSDATDAVEEDTTSNSSLGQAAEAACDKAVECAGEDSPIGRDLLCAAYSAYETSANFFGGACSSATESFLNCFAATECDSTEAPCQSEIASLQSSCAPGVN